MRPLRLDISGFAAFRDATTVDFSGADYFALTGPTGSGKSTVIDAMTFALYGSAPRWGRENAIQYALAPTANRCAVRLVFDVAGRRYVAAREVRRSGKQVAQRNARLERYLDPAASGDPTADEPTESLAADPRAVRQQVAELLGLDFEDFCTCVVLPQGDFATFLQASVGERQAILLKLLGARHYETIGRMANRRATEANARVDALQGQLASYDDASEAAVTSARAREQVLAELHTSVTADVAAASTVLDRRARLAAQVDRLSDELAQLDRVVVPAGIDELQRRADAADRRYRDAATSEREAAEVQEASEAALAAGPAAGPLEETLGRHRDLAREAARVPAAAAAMQRATVTHDLARRAAENAEHALEQHRHDDEHHRAVRAAAAATVERWTEQLTALRSVVVPEGTAALDEAAHSAARAARAAELRLADAESAARAARAAVQDLPERSAMLAVQRTIEDYAGGAAQRALLRRRRDELTAQVATAADEVAAARHAVERARTEVEHRQAQSSAAGLRPLLEVGHTCPVCEQRVGVLPAALAVPELEGARAIADERRTVLREAEAVAAELRTQLTGLTAQAAGVDERLAALDRALRQDLTAQPAGDVRNVERDRAVAADLLSRLEAAVAAADAADRDREAARTAVRTAQHQDALIAEQTAAGWAALHAARGRMSTLDPAPSSGSGGLAASWTALVDWTTGRAEELETTELSRARTALAVADAALTASAERVRDAGTAARRASAELTVAAVAEAKATAEHDDLIRRVAELQTWLADRPGDAEARALLSEHRQLAEAAETARANTRTAVRSRQDAETERDRCRAERDAARSALHRLRESLITLEVPAVDDADLGRAWAGLSDWARGRSSSARLDLENARAEHAVVEDELVDKLARLGSLLAEHGLSAAVPSAGDLTAPDAGVRLGRVPTEVEIAVERARAATAELTRRRQAAEQLRRLIEADTTTEQVARQLAVMMSAKRFPQWLADAALDSLVGDASASLMQLSGGQFELTHDKGEFFVIDHADADSARSVKTLSGGETFQASLALALALSEQLSTLAAGGRTTLDSIFLDEGFGTLDPDALEIVATTLENLAQGNRMVGVVTHVAALAERVPVRFQVSRDSRTSTIERIGA